MADVSSNHTVSIAGIWNSKSGKILEAQKRLETKIDELTKEGVPVRLETAILSLFVEIVPRVT